MPRKLLLVLLFGLPIATELSCTSDDPDPEKRESLVADDVVIMEITRHQRAGTRTEEEWTTKSLSKDATLTVKLVNSSNEPFTLLAAADSTAAGLRISLFRNGQPVDGFDAKQIEIGSLRKVTLQRNESFIHVDRLTDPWRYGKHLAPGRYRVHIIFHVPPGNPNESAADLDKWTNLDLVE